MIAILLVSAALSADVDRGPAGDVVTIRPEDFEHVAILDAANHAAPLPTDTPSPMWLVAPSAWRAAVARVAELAPYEDAARKCDVDLEIAKRQGADCENALQDALLHESALGAENKMLRRQRWVFAGAGMVVGAALTAGGIVAIAW